MTPSDLTAWRKRLGLNKIRAAEALGCDRGSLSAWEAGTYPIPVYIALACAALALGIKGYPSAP